MICKPTLCSPKPYGTLTLTTFGEYWDMLECVPPVARNGGRFAVGEAYADRWQFGGEFPDGDAHRAVYACYYAVEGNGYDETDTYVCGYFTLQDYRAVTQAELRNVKQTPMHTPEPWESNRNGSYWSILGPDRNLHGDGITSVPVAVVVQSNPEATANSRLIAAAPELLRALTEIVSQIDQGGLGGKVFSRDACISAARAAISNANGR